jgi:hypothetical protein
MGRPNRATCRNCSEGFVLVYCRSGVGFSGGVDRHDPVHVRHPLGQGPHIDQRAADGAVSKVLDLVPLGVLTVDVAGVFGIGQKQPQPVSVALQRSR